jgi:acyl carrier protein
MPDTNHDADIRDLVYSFFAEECDMDQSELTDQTHIIEDLEGDSLMLLSLLEIVRRKYGLGVELKTLGKHLMKKPANTLGEVVTLTRAIVQHGDNIINMDL